MEDNHGKVGKALYLKFTSGNFITRFNPKRNVAHGEILTVDDMYELCGVSSVVPFHIDDDTQENYECVCEFGTEIW